uniref:HesA/MoeB/ThiF family protein n=1 Tax=Desulfacinum infernum TaxID=35837 RepID=A0A832E9T3_9BACT
MISTTVVYGGRSVRVIEDADLLKWAAQNDLPPWEAQREALRNGILPARYLKNLWTLHFEDQKALAASTVFVCGCGGLGGVSAQLLARAGIGHLILCDADSFYPTNLNRQWFAYSENLGRPKAEEAAEGCRRINPLIQVTPFQEPLGRENADRLLGGSQVAVDALDNLESRFVLEEACRNRRIPWVHGAVAGWFGQIATFLPESLVGLEAVYGGRRDRTEAEQDLGVPGPTPAVIGSLQAMEVLRLLTRRPPAYAGRLLYFDGETGTLHGIPLAESSKKD